MTRLPKSKRNIIPLHLYALYRYLDELENHWHGRFTSVEKLRSKVISTDYGRTEGQTGRTDTLGFDIK